MPEIASARPDAAPRTAQAGYTAATDMAAAYLASRGYRILDQNWRNDGGELAIVAADRGTLVAIEVKTRSRSYHGRPLTAIIAPARVRRLRRLAVRWQDAHATRYDRIRIDIIGVVLDGAGGYTIEHVKEAGLCAAPSPAAQLPPVSPATS